MRPDVRLENLRGNRDEADKPADEIVDDNNALRVLTRNRVIDIEPVK